MAELLTLEYEDGVLTFPYGLADIHAHPRAFDPIVDAVMGPDGRPGKAGLPLYSEAALRSGFVHLGCMPNEARRIIDPNDPEHTILDQFPIANLGRAKMFETALSTQSVIDASYHFGLERKEVLSKDGQSLKISKIRANFQFGAINAAALKLWADESTGGQEIPPVLVPQVISEWHKFYPNKPVIIHAEDENVAAVIEGVRALRGGDKIPLHIAHVSSRQELEAVIIAKENGMNITCEVTPHHLFVNADDVTDIGGYGCMKPTLKSPEDVQFLRDNMRYIDIIASDCAPHMRSEKEAAKPAYGVTNHTSMMPLLLGAVEEGWLTDQDLFEKLVINPRKRFNLRFDDTTVTRVDMNMNPVSARELEESIKPGYGYNIMAKLEEDGKRFHLAGRVVLAMSGSSVYRLDEKGRVDTRYTRYATDICNLVTVK